MNFKIEKGKIISDEGIPYLPRWFCDDLVAFEADKHGISKIEYFNRTTKGSEKVFVDDMWGGMRFYIEDNSRHYGQNLKYCEIMPYGFCGEWHYKEYTFTYEQRVINNCVFVSLKPECEIAPEVNISAEFYDNWSLITRKDGDNRYRSGVERIWDKWNFDGRYLRSHYREGSGETHIIICQDSNAQYIKRSVGNPKHILTSDCNEYILVIAFDESEEKAIHRADDTLKNYKFYIEEQNNRYEEIIKNMPVLESPYKPLNNFFALASMYHESCKVQSVPGAVRAKTEHYWVWGWDGMSSSFAYSYWGDVDFISKLLNLYMETADPEKGIGHWFARDMSHIETSMLPAQGFYISLLYQYCLNGGDISPYYEFAKRIFKLIAATECNNTGLCEGYSLVPDFRETILENGHDLSAFNNSSLYCAVCAMTYMAEKMGDCSIKRQAEELAQRMKEGFAKLLFDEEKGFFAASADSDTFEQRKIYMSPSVKWDNLYCYDLVKENQKRIVEFFENNFVCDCGIMFTPVWDRGYDADANQLHCYWPANSECYARLINFENRKDLIEKLISWIACWTDILMCPEGIDCYDEVNEPKPDGWNAVNGTWQAYSMRAWYEAAVHSIVGVDFNENGMNIYPYDGEEMILKNLHFAGKTFDIYMKGSGCGVENVILNGQSVGAVREISMNSFGNCNVVEVIRSKK